ncbi:DAO-domain-containing protein [Myriangium duriaei CBS 260.36]|uniref:DAO-domain-containing protein n=1 Tax=Myriangium duriaei CBS 260.36 TaxID=1168546 RepID=A0A9P4J9U4_9PEZI|nr:DAO-domain-containing protein [Myriangium duriaei CBS 260.36]
MMDSFSYWDREPKESIWWAPHVRSFNIVPSPDLPAPLSPKVTATFRSIAVNAPQYLLRLRSTVLARGGTFIRSRISSAPTFAASLASVAGTVKRITRSHPAVWVNALGLGAKDIAHDDSMYPVKGQTVLVKGEADAIRTALYEGGISYVIPRPGSGTTVLGGTNEVGNADRRVVEEVTGRTLERTRALAPELCTGKDGGFEVVSVQVGFRPGRKGGARMEREIVKVGDGGEEYRVVHAYGHGGAGYQNSIGVGRRVLDMVRESVGTSEGEEKAKL